jgi:hypothetical protein
MPNDELYKRLPTIRQYLKPEEYEKLKERVLEPYKMKNRVMGLGLFGFVGAVCKFACSNHFPIKFKLAHNCISCIFNVQDKN